MKINSDFKQTWKYFMYSLKFLIDFHTVDYLIGKKASLASGLRITGCTTDV